MYTTSKQVPPKQHTPTRSTMRGGRRVPCVAACSHVHALIKQYYKQSATKQSYQAIGRGRGDRGAVWYI